MMPAARPSRPSIRFTALAMPTTQSTVSSTDHSADRNTKSQNGTRNTSMDMPAPYSTTAAAAIPATLAGGDSPLTSSRKPVANSTATPATPPRISPGASRMSGTPPTADAAAAAATTPASIAMPPAAGVAVSWMWCSSGGRLAPTRTASLAVSGTKTKVTTAATPPTTANGSTDPTPDAYPSPVPTPPLRPRPTSPRCPTPGRAAWRRTAFRRRPALRPPRPRRSGCAARGR